jgi:hypothetical protein
MEELEDLFGSELGFLRTVLANYIERNKAVDGSGFAVRQDNEALKN